MKIGDILGWGLLLIILIGMGLFVYVLFGSAVQTTKYHEETVVGKYFEDGHWYIRTENFSAQIKEGDFLTLENNSRVIIGVTTHPLTPFFDDGVYYYGRLS